MWDILEHKANIYKLYIFRVMLSFENLTVVELLKKSPTFHGIQVS